LGKIENQAENFGQLLSKSGFPQFGQVWISKSKQVWISSVWCHSCLRFLMIQKNKEKHDEKVNFMI